MKPTLQIKEIYPAQLSAEHRISAWGVPAQWAVTILLGIVRINHIFLSLTQCVFPKLLLLTRISGKYGTQEVDGEAKEL